MNEGGSTLGGNQTASGGTDALDSTSLKISHDAPSSDTLSINHSPTPPESTPPEPTFSESTSPDPTSSPELTSSPQTTPPNLTTSSQTSTPEPISLESTPSLSEKQPFVSSPDTTPSSTPEVILPKSDQTPISVDANLSQIDLNSPQNSPNSPSAQPIDISSSNLTTESTTTNPSSVTPETIFPSDSNSSLEPSPSPDPNASSDIPITEAVVIPTSDDTGAARLFGQDISGITDEDLGPASNVSPIQTVVFPGTNATEELESSPETAPNSNATDSASSGISSPESASAPEPEPTPAPAPAPTPPPAPAPQPAPASQPDPNAYERQFLQDLHDSDDIIINPELDSKPKKPVVITLVVGALAICLVGIIAIITFSGIGKNQQSAKPSPLSETEQAFNAYNEALKTWKRTEKKSTENLKNLYQSFYDVAIDDPVYGVKQPELASYIDLMTFAEYIGPLKEYDYNTLMNDYLELGYDETLENIQTIYNSESAPENVKEYLDTQSEYLETLLIAFEQYVENGCFDEDNNLDYTCAIDSEETDPELLESRRETYSAVESINGAKDLVFSLIENSYKDIKESVGQNAE